jgi:uncharacterized membrane protein (UPF0127 family)
MNEITLTNLTQTNTPVFRAGYCSSFVCKLRGLTFRGTLPPYWGLMLVQTRDSRMDAAIHMMMMRIDLAVVWINDAFEVVDVRPAYRWRSVIVPDQPARYIFETSLEYLPLFHIGDHVQFT